MAPKRAQSEGAEFRRGPAYIPGRAYTIGQWAQFEQDGVITCVEQIANENHDPVQDARMRVLLHHLMDARPSPPSDIPSVATPPPNTAQSVVTKNTPSGDNTVAPTPVAPVGPPVALHIEAADTTPMAPPANATADADLGARDTVDEVMMVPPPATSYMSAAIGLLQSTLRRNKKREIVPSPCPHIQDTDADDQMRANTGGNGDRVPTPGTADESSKRAKFESTFEYNQRVSKEWNKKQEALEQERKEKEKRDTAAIPEQEEDCTSDFIARSPRAP
eukprot:4108677-Amphidinium_carterae.3